MPSLWSRLSGHQSFAQAGSGAALETERGRFAPPRAYLFGGLTAPSTVKTKPFARLRSEGILLPRVVLTLNADTSENKP